MNSFCEPDSQRQCILWPTLPKALCDHHRKIPFDAIHQLLSILIKFVQFSDAGELKRIEQHIAIREWILREYACSAYHLQTTYL